MPAREGSTPPTHTGIFPPCAGVGVKRTGPIAVIPQEEAVEPGFLRLDGQADKVSGIVGEAGSRDRPADAHRTDDRARRPGSVTRCPAALLYPA